MNARISEMPSGSDEDSLGAARGVALAVMLSSGFWLSLVVAFWTLL